MKLLWRQRDWGRCWSGVGEIDTNSKILFRVCNERAMKNAEFMNFLDIFLFGGKLELWICFNYIFSSLKSRN